MFGMVPLDSSNRDGLLCFAFPSTQVIPLGLFRPKAENPFWRLNYVAANPAWSDVVDVADRVFVLIPAT